MCCQSTGAYAFGEEGEKLTDSPKEEGGDAVDRRKGEKDGDDAEYRGEIQFQDSESEKDSRRGIAENEANGSVRKPRRLLILRKIIADQFRSCNAGGGKKGEAKQGEGKSAELSVWCGKPEERDYEEERCGNGTG